MTSRPATRELFYIGNGRVSHLLQPDLEQTLCGRTAQSRYPAGAGEPGCERCYRRSVEVRPDGHLYRANRPDND